MKRTSLPLILILLIALALSACSAAPTEQTTSSEAAEPVAAEESEATEAPAEPVAAPVVLTLVGPEQEMTFTMEELKALPATSGQAGMKSSTGKITVPALYTGVLLTDLIEMVGGLSPEYGVSVVAADGYAMTLSYDQITQGDFITYDPSDGSEKQVDEPLQALVAYEMDGQPLNVDRDGNLRLVVISDKNNQVTDGHWSVKWVERIEVQPLVKEWTLGLDGVRNEVIDRNTFQSCGATSCHQSTWTDGEGQVWSGVPLYLLAGRMDDEITHDGPAYNRDLAEAGYLIELIASDGYTTTIDSQTAFYNRQILVANLVDNTPLPDKYFPLRLVGESLEKSQSVGALSEIRLLIDESLLAAEEEPTEAPTEEAPAAGMVEEPPAGTALWITGKVANSLALTADGVKAFEVVEIQAEHPKKGLQTYTGVYLSSLMSLASPQEGATSLVLTAGDGYSTTIDLAALQACKDCLLSFTDTEGVYQLVMPAFESSAWVKEIVKIEVQ